MNEHAKPPRVADYGLIGDCRSAALVSSEGSIDWCCLPRFDSGSAFARLLDPGRGGFCELRPRELEHAAREYEPRTLVLATTFQTRRGSARLLDCFLMPDPDDPPWRRRILRVVEGLHGTVTLDLRVAVRFDYGEVRPWLRRHDDRLFSAIGGDDALVVFGEQGLSEDPAHELAGEVTVTAGKRARLLLAYTLPERLQDRAPTAPDPHELDEELDATREFWREWSQTVRYDGQDPALLRSALTLKALTYMPTGAIAAAPTTSLPEAPGHSRNWDYRYAWVRDSSFSSRAFAEVGCEREADAFRAFIMRSAAGHADDLQIVYGLGGERRIGPQRDLQLAGYEDSTPVRLGNGAVTQQQFDAYGELVNLTWRWHRRGNSPDDDGWRFLVSLIDRAAELCTEPDCGIWEWPDGPQHFVHSKVLCWSALDRGIRLADECMRRAPVRRWRRTRDELREAIEAHGYDEDRGIYTQVYDQPELDAALLLLPTVEYLDWQDPKMLRTAEAVRTELGAGDPDRALLYRYRRDDTLDGREGAFLACSFWLAEALARGGDPVEARTVFDAAVAAGNDLCLFSEELDPASGELLGNFPQALTHLAHVSAAVALAEAAEAG